MSNNFSGVLQFMIRAATGISSRSRNLYYKARGVEICGYAWLRRIDIPQNFRSISLANGVALDSGVVLRALGPNSDKKKITIGENTYVNRNSFIDASEEIRIGRNVAIGPRCYITDHDRGTRPDQPGMDYSLSCEKTIICDGVWLGTNVIVLKGVTIGVNTVVSAGSVVVEDLPANVIAGGRPAVPIRKR